MADTKISALAAYSTVDAADLLPIVDVSDTSMAASGTDKASTLTTLLGGITGDTTFAGLAGTTATVKGNAVAYTQFSQVTPVTVTASGTTTLLVATNAKGSLTIASGAMNGQGRVLRITFGGYATTAASSPGTSTLGVFLGGNCVGTMGTPAHAASAANTAFSGYIDICCLSTGSNGTSSVCGLVISESTLTIWNATTHTFANGSTLGTKAPTTPQTVNWTGTLALDFQINLSASTNSFTLTNFTATIEP